MIFDVVRQQFLKRGNQALLLAFVHLELRAHSVVVFLDSIEGFSGQTKEGVRKFLEGFAGRRTDVKPLLLQSARQGFPLLQVVHAGEGLGLCNQLLLQLQVLLQVVLLQLLVDVDVVEEFVAKAVVLVVRLFVPVAGNISSAFPLFPHLVETGKRSPDVLFFLDDAPQLVNQPGLDFQIGPLFLCNALAPCLFSLFELVHQCVELNLFSTGLELEFVLGLVLLFFPGFSLGTEVFLDQRTK